MHTSHKSPNNVKSYSLYFKLKYSGRQKCSGKLSSTIRIIQGVPRYYYIINTILHNIKVFQYYTLHDSPQHPGVVLSSMAREYLCNQYDIDEKMKYEFQRGWQKSSQYWFHFQIICFGGSQVLCSADIQVITMERANDKELVFCQQLQLRSPFKRY